MTFALRQMRTISINVDIMSIAPEHNVVTENRRKPTNKGNPSDMLLLLLIYFSKYTRYNPAASPTAAAGPTATATPALADSPVRTVPLPSDRDYEEPMGTRLLRLTPSPGDTPAAPTKSEALGDAAELRFLADFIARYSHADWKREQHAEPTCHTMMRYISIGRPSVLPPNFLAGSPPRKTSLPLRHRRAGG